MIFSRQPAGRSVSLRSRLTLALNSSPPSPDRLPLLPLSSRYSLLLLVARKSVMFHLRSLSRRSCLRESHFPTNRSSLPFLSLRRQPRSSRTNGFGTTFRPASRMKERKKERDSREAVLLLRRINLRHFRPLLPFAYYVAPLGVSPRRILAV